MRHSVNSIIQNKAGKYLLQMRDNTEGICNPLKWNFFGGNFKDNENPLTAAVREIQEELGIKAEIDQFISLGELQPKENQTVHVVHYKQPTEWKDIILQEGAGAGYFTKEELQKIDITDATQTLINTYL